MQAGEGNEAVTPSTPQTHRTHGDSGHSSSEEDQFKDSESSEFLKLMNFIYNQFEEARGDSTNFRDKSPGPGQEDFVSHKKGRSLSRFRWSRPMKNSVKFVDKSVSDRLHDGRSATLPYTHRNRRKWYEVSCVV